MLTQAAGLAVLAAISPTALLVAAVFLGAASPRRTALLYLAGAVVVTAVMTATLFVVLRAGHLYRPQQHSARYGLRLGLGLLMLAGTGYLRWRGRRPKDPARQSAGLLSRMIARPGPKEAFIVGVLVYLPSLTFVAAVQVIATSDADTAAIVAALALVIVITLAFVWLPLLLFVLMPDRTGRMLASFNEWLRVNGPILLACALGVGGVLLTLNGILGLTGVLA
jgi:hypothetical protein